MDHLGIAEARFRTVTDGETIPRVLRRDAEVDSTGGIAEDHQTAGNLLMD